MASTSSPDVRQLSELARLIRYWILTSTNRAGSGHPTSALSAVELMTDLVFGGHFRYDPQRPEHPANDRLIFSKGHASPLLYALWGAAGQVSEQDLMRYREFGSPLEGHPTSRFRFAEAATGSLGQGLSIGVGMAMAARHDQLPYRTYVLLGDSEMAEGSQWEAMQIASHYQLDQLVGILDVNRLGQRGETMYGHDLGVYERRIRAFGWETITVDDGHDHRQVLDAYARAAEASGNGQPVMLIAKTIKGKGVSFLEGKDDMHGKPVEDDDIDRAVEELGQVDRSLRGTLLAPPDARTPTAQGGAAEPLRYEEGEKVATRKAYGKALARIGGQYPRLVALDGEVCNSTHAKLFREAFPDRYFEMYIAEQNMVGTALGLSLRGKTPFVSTFAAFLSRAFDQIRMCPHSSPNIKFVGSHAGVSIGKDGPSQMGLEDLAMFRTVLDSVVLYPCDAVSTERLVEAMAEHQGISYLRTTRGDTPVIYDASERFPIGGCKVLRHSDRDVATIVAAGVTVFEALKAYDRLQEDGLSVRVIDLYSIKPLDAGTLAQAATETEALITVEDHYPAGGLGEAVCRALSTSPTPVECLAVEGRPQSGTTDELLDDVGISANRIVERVRRTVAHAAVT